MENYLMEFHDDEFNALDPIWKQVDITVNMFKVHAEKVNEKETEQLINQFANKFCNSKINYYLWEGICNAVNDLALECVAVSNDNAWRWVKEFVCGRTIIFFNPEDEKVSYIFDDGKEIVEILSECYNFEFYITNCNLDYVLAYSHHRVLYACGTAAKWLGQYKDSYQNNPIIE